MFKHRIVSHFLPPSWHFTMPVTSTPGIAYLELPDEIYTTSRRSMVSPDLSDLKEVSVRSPFTALDNTLDILEPARMDASTRSECLAGTRTDILRSIADWAKSTSVEKRLLWLKGVAGSGKSTLSTTIVHALQEQGRLGAFVFFSRDVEERSQPANVIRTIAYQLASFSPVIRTAIAQAIDTTPRITQSALRFQFTKLLIEPLRTLPATGGPVVLILDALDECGSAEDRKPLLSLLSSESVHLPSFVRILITSRDERDIRCALEEQSHVLIRELNLTLENNTNDILYFFRSRMAEIRSTNKLARDWPGDSAIFALCKQAAGLFVWASTACRFINGYDPLRNLDVVLSRGMSTKAQSALDALYQTALKSAVKDIWDDEYFRTDFCSIMGTILVARNPISDKTIDTLLSLERPSRYIISRLGCVLHCSETGPVRILHPSFADFLSDRLRCGSDLWHVDTLLHNRLLAVHCISHLNSVLRRNFRNLVLSQANVDEVLPEATSYACTSWIDHVCAIMEDADLVRHNLDQFLFRHLLHWIEAMSILKKSKTTITSVLCLHDWLGVRGPVLLTSHADGIAIATPTPTN